MAKYGSASFAVFLLDGYNMLAAQVQNFTHTVKATLEDITGLGDSWTQKTATGELTQTMTQSGAFFDDSTAGIHVAMKTAGATERIGVFAVAGNVIGQPFVGIKGLFGMDYSANPKRGSLTKADVAYSLTGQRDQGTILLARSSRSADWNTKTDGNQVDYSIDTIQQVIPITSATKANPCVVTTTIPHGLTSGQVILPSGNTLSGPSINSRLAVTVLSTTTFSVAVNTTGSSGAGTGGSFVLCSTVNGGVGYLQVSDFAGYSGVVVKIRSSADDSTYADLITFTSVTSAPGTATASQRVSVSGTVDEYLCCTGTGTGSGSINPFVGFARS